MVIYYLINGNFTDIHISGLYFFYHKTKSIETTAYTHHVLVFSIRIQNFYHVGKQVHHTQQYANILHIVLEVNIRFCLKIYLPVLTWSSTKPDISIIFVRYIMS